MTMPRTARTEALCRTCVRACALVAAVVLFASCQLREGMTQGAIGVGKQTGTANVSATASPRWPGCSGVPVSPGTHLQHMFDTHPSGTTFCFSPGTYVLTNHVRPRSRDRLISATRRATIPTGRNRYDGGIVGTGGSSGEHDVLVQGFVIRHFANRWPTFPRSPLQAGLNWTIRDNEIAYNSQAGVSVNSGTRLVGNWIHHNGRYGIS